MDHQQIAACAILFLAMAMFVWNKLRYDLVAALALGADAVSIGQGVLIALGCNDSSYQQHGQRVHDVAETVQALKVWRALQP